MQLDFQYNRPDVIEALRFHFMNRPEMKLFRTVLMVLVLLSFVGYWMKMINLQVVIWLFLLFIVLVLVFWYILPYSVYKKAKTFHEPVIHLRWNDRGLSIGTHQGESSMLWSRFDRIVETREFFFLYRDNKSFFLIPVEAFNDELEKNSFAELLHTQFRNYRVKK